MKFPAWAYARIPDKALVEIKPLFAVLLAVPDTQDQYEVMYLYAKQDKLYLGTSLIGDDCFQVQCGVVIPNMSTAYLMEGVRTQLAQLGVEPLAFTRLHHAQFKYVGRLNTNRQKNYTGTINTVVHNGNRYVDTLGILRAIRS